MDIGRKLLTLKDSEGNINSDGQAIISDDEPLLAANLNISLACFTMQINFDVKEAQLLHPVHNDHHNFMPFSWNLPESL